MQVELLLDKSRLQEIFDLRVAAYESSFKSQYVNKQLFPNGWKDHLDNLDNTFHWIIIDKNTIVASARISILNYTEETGENFNKFLLPAERPFAYWSRLVVHPYYRKYNFMQLLDKERKSYILKKKIAFTISCATDERTSSFIRLGFKHLGDFNYNWANGSKQIVHAFCYHQTKIQ